jgi:hypothetical protein
MPDIAFTGGYLNKNKLIVYESKDPLIFQPVQTENAILFQITNLQAKLRSNDFGYTGGLIPIRGYLDVSMSGILLRVKI